MEESEKEPSAEDLLKPQFIQIVEAIGYEEETTEEVPVQDVPELGDSHILETTGTMEKSEVEGLAEDLLKPQLVQILEAFRFKEETTEVIPIQGVPELEDNQILETTGSIKEP